MAWRMSQPPRLHDSDMAPDRGDTPAWVIEYGPALRRYFSKKVGAADAEDLVQDVFVALQERDLANVEHLGRYVFGIASKVLARRGRMRSVRPVDCGDIDQLAALLEEPSAERSLIAKDALARLVEALKLLPPRSAQAFILHRFEEMSYGEIAAYMNIGVRTVESHVERTMARLFLILGPR